MFHFALEVTITNTFSSDRRRFCGSVASNVEVIQNACYSLVLCSSFGNLHVFEQTLRSAHSISVGSPVSLKVEPLLISDLFFPELKGHAVCSADINLDDNTMMGVYLER